MTTASPPRRVTRCSHCGRHKTAAEFPSKGRVCKTCINARRRANADARRTTGKDTRRGNRRRGAAAPEAVPAGREAGGPEPDVFWHRCDGADVHPKHRAIHRRGFWTEGPLVITFVERFCVFGDGPRRGEVVGTVPPPLAELLVELYRIAPDGRRQYRRALIGMAKKNTKTTIAAWLGLWHLYGDAEPTPRVSCAAASEEQADLVFGTASRTLAAGKEHTDASVAQFWQGLEGWEREILRPDSPGAKLTRLAAGAGNLDGPNQYVTIADELHEWRQPKSVTTFDVLNQAGTLRDAPLFIMITTAGFDRESLCYGLYEHGKRVEEHPDLDPTFFFVWYEPEGKLAERPIDDEEAWRAANPLAGYTVQFDRYLEDLNDPRNTESMMKRYRRNQWVQAEELWLPDGVWADLALVPFPPLDPAKRIVVGVDASRVNDATAVVVLEAEGYGMNELQVRVEARIWERPIGPDGRLDPGWEMDFDELERHVLSLAYGTDVAGEPWCIEGRCACGCDREYPALGIENVGADPMFLAQFIQKLERLGVPVVKVPQTDQRMVPGTEDARTLIAARRLRHNGDPQLARHVGNAVARKAASGGDRLDKKKTNAYAPQDAALAMVIGMYLLGASTPDDGETNIW